MFKKQINTPFSLTLREILFVLFFGPFLFYGQFLKNITSKTITDSATQNYLIDSIKITGNTKTKQKIVLRELNFKVGDSVSLLEIASMQARSQQNLINTSLFIFVTISHELINEKINVLIDVKERWYLWPNPIFEIQDRNFNSWWQTKDLSRINYGMYLTFQNLFGLNQSLTLKIRKGYTENYGFSYKIPYLNKKQTIGLNLSYLFSSNNEIAFNTFDNRLIFFRNSENYVRKESESKISFTLRKDLYIRHNLEFSFNESVITDSILKSNANYFSNNKNKINYLSISYNFKRDVRDNKIYPLSGNIFTATLLKQGLGIIPIEDVDNFSAFLTISQFKVLAPRFFLANHARARYSLSKRQCYYFNRGLGFGNDVVRGYEYYIIDGQSFCMLKTNFKYQLVKPKIYTADWAKRLRKFNKVPYTVYLGAYGDAAFVEDKLNYINNPLSNSFLVGAGIGLDFVTYYDSVFRIEFSINQNQEVGVYLHLSSPF